MGPSSLPCWWCPPNQATAWVVLSRKPSSMPLRNGEIINKVIRLPCLTWTHSLSSLASSHLFWAQWSFTSNKVESFKEATFWSTANIKAKQDNCQGGLLPMLLIKSVTVSTEMQVKSESLFSSGDSFAFDNRAGWNVWEMGWRRLPFPRGVLKTCSHLSLKWTVKVRFSDLKSEWVET